MSVEYVTGDLFAQDLPALGHGVNCAGLMGAGIAAQFRRRWPRMYQVYRQACHDGELRPGLVLPYWTGTGSPAVVYNLATQDRPGRHARLKLVDEAVATMLEHAADHHLSAVGIPQLGCGIGGLAWTDVRPLLEGLAAGGGVRLVVVTLP